jgi:molecular chaperone DnaK
MPIQGLEDLLPSQDPVMRLVESLRSGFEAEHGVDLGQDPLASQRLQAAVRQAAEELASATSTTVHLPFITATENGPLHLHATVTRAQLGT